MFQLLVTVFDLKDENFENEHDSEQNPSIYAASILNFQMWDYYL